MTRFIVYGIAGYASETLFTLVARRPKLPHPAMVSIYGLAAAGFPPVRRAVRARRPLTRAAAYGAATIAAEYVIGRGLRAIFGAAPWTYNSRFALDGLTRLDYLPLWACYGLALERLEDAITARRA